MKRISGNFDEGAVVEVQSLDGRPFAKAVSSFSAVDLQVVLGHDSSEFTALLGGAHKGVIFRPEDMVFLDDEN